MRIRSLNDLPESLRAQVGAIAKPSKYGNRRVMVDGERFDSALEARCCRWLKLRWKAGDVLWFIRQAPFTLEGNVRYRCDFLAVTASSVEVWDAKGFDTPASRNKRKQVMARYGIEVQLWSDR